MGTGGKRLRTNERCWNISLCSRIGLLNARTAGNLEAAAAFFCCDDCLLVLVGQ